MPRYSRRRYYRKKTLSTRKIFSRTSAKSQASQIYALRKKINKVARVCRPEIKQFITAPGSFTFSNSIGSSPYNIMYGTGPNLGTGADNRIGNKIFIRAFKLNSYFEYYNTPAGPHDSESTGAAIRIILLQRKDNTAAYNETIDPQDIIANYANSGAGYTISSVAPLIPGIRDKYYILYDRTRTITLDKNQLTWKISVKPRPYEYNISDQSHINNVVSIILVSGLHYDNDYTDYCTGAFTFKFVYSDA